MSSSPSFPSRSRLSADLLARFDRPGPRYTSYPTADRFVEPFDADVVRETWSCAALSADKPSNALGVYVHVPFCESVCYYCACNKTVTRDTTRAVRYVAALRREIRMVADLAGSGHRLQSLHLGGGTPTYLDDEQLASVVGDLRARFDFAADAELAIEVDPRTVDAQRLATLRRIGFDRISFGVQDFDPTVQVAIHRVQPYDAVRAIVQAARAERFASINVDLIYGLPRQTPESFARTVAMTTALRPDRISLYAYAHLPQRFKPQRRIQEDELPGASDRVALLDRAIDGFLAAGYEHVGMDHFALPTDALARTKREGRLHRDFQGYGTHGGLDLVAVGISAIGRVGSVYYQNAKDLDVYYAAVESGRLPIERGVHLDQDDVLRRAAIMAVMCAGEIDYARFDDEHGVDPRDYFREELESLRSFAQDGLIQIDLNGLRLTRNGWFLVRSIATVFDRYLRGAPTPSRFSRLV